MEIAQPFDEKSQGRVYASVFVSLAEQGEIDMANKVSQAIKERYLYCLEFAIIDSVKQSKSLQLQQLLQFLPDVSRKMKVLNELAEYYIEVGEKEQATELLNEALSMI